MALDAIDGIVAAAVRGDRRMLAMADRTTVADAVADLIRGVLP